MTTTTSFHSRRSNIMPPRRWLWLVLTLVIMAYSQLRFLAQVRTMTFSSSLGSGGDINDDPTVIGSSTTSTATTRNTFKSEIIYNSTIASQSEEQSINNKTLQVASDTISSTTSSPLDVCFVVSVYADWAIHADQLQDVSRLDFYGYPQVHFYAFTNLPRLQAKGWTKVIRFHQEYSRYITQSRYIKFWAWNETMLQRHCHVIFYMDSIGHIIGSWQEFQTIARNIYESTSGHAQYLHKGGGGAFGEFRRIEVFHKDVMENIQASKEWLLERPDFDPPSVKNCTLYENRYIGYAVGRPTTFQKAAVDCLWPRYSLEVDSWRDQPLWCYCLDRYNITPIPLPHQKLWKLQPSRMGKQGHKYKTVQDAQVKSKKGKERQTIT